MDFGIQTARNSSFLISPKGGLAHKVYYIIQTFWPSWGTGILVWNYTGPLSVGERGSLSEAYKMCPLIRQPAGRKRCIRTAVMISVDLIGHLIGRQGLYSSLWLPYLRSVCSIQCQGAGLVGFGVYIVSFIVSRVRIASCLILKITFRKNIHLLFQPYTTID